jgi:hypothetical protein
MSACCERTHQRIRGIRGLFTRMGYMTVTTSNYMRLTAPMAFYIDLQVTQLAYTTSSEPETASQFQAEALSRLVNTFFCGMRGF